MRVYSILKGNIVSDQNGLVNMTLVDNISQLYGRINFIQWALFDLN